MKARKIISLLLVIALTLTLLAACAKKGGDQGGNTDKPDTSGAPQTEEKYADSIEIVIDNNPIANLDPIIPAAHAPATYWVLIMIHDRLLDFAGDGVFTPSLATKWETDDYKTYKLTLRDDVYFHNGEKFTANDVVFTAYRSIEAVGSQAYGLWNPVDTIKAISDTEVEIVLKEVNVDFLFNLSRPMASILNQKACEADVEKGPWVGTGAYKVADFLSSDHTTVVRNDDYWGTPGITREMTFRYVPETSTRTIMMQNRECQISFGVGNEDLSLFEEDPSFVVYPQYVNNPQGFAFNMNDPITGDLNFRLAFIYGIDREEIAIVARGDWAAAPTEGTLWGLKTEFRNSDIPVIPYDPDKAAEYLSKSSYNGQTVEIAVGNPTNVLAAETIQRQLEKIGIKIEIKVMDPASLNAYNAYDNNQSQVSAPSMAFSLSAAAANNLFYPGGANNRASYNNPEVTELLVQAKVEGDLGKREAIYKKVQEIVAQDVPCVQLFWLVLGVVATENVKNLDLPSDTYAVDLRGTYMVLED
ncbi:MAG: ABC transporter substrate-binding protein [Clostridiales bacterium]|nr:ABC transporter substrate-binding protein [Clostridiales bacterium]